MNSSRRGFTLVELMIVIAIIGVLAAIGVANYINVTRKSGEATTKGNLGMLRSALAIYYGDNEGLYPSDDLTSLTNNLRYVVAIPIARTQPYHLDSTTVLAETTVTDSAMWSYDNDSADLSWGQIHVGCLHSDVQGQTWSSY